MAPPSRQIPRRVRRTVRTAALAGLVGIVGACGVSVDAEQVRICRIALPALNPEGGRITVLGARPGRETGSVRIEYRVERPDRTPVQRHVVCGFAAEGLRAGRSELVSLSTERGPLSGASLYLLKRFYIETPEGVRNDPGLGERADGLPQAPPAVAYGLQQGLVSLPRTAIYGLLATAYALVFGLVGRFNLAFGELAAVGAAATVSGVAIATSLGVASPAAGLGLGLAAALGAGAMHGAVGGWATIARVRAASPQPSLVATVGLSLALMEYLRLVQSPVATWIPPVWSGAIPLLRSGDFVVSVTPITLVTAGLGLAAALAVLALMAATPFGRAWRAYADDAGAAALVGVDGARLLLVTLSLAGALAGAAGMLVVAQYGALGFAGGFGLGLKALAAAVLGGVGSVGGALVGGLLIGGVETLWQAFLPIEGRDVALYALLVAVLVLRPGGLFGNRGPTPREV